MLYWALYINMLISFFALSITAPTQKEKAIGFLITLVNALLFYR